MIVKRIPFNSVKFKTVFSRLRKTPALVHRDIKSMPDKSSEVHDPASKADLNHELREAGCAGPEMSWRRPFSPSPLLPGLQFGFRDLIRTVGSLDSQTDELELAST